jgi:hypothetical protein
LIRDENGTPALGLIDYGQVKRLSKETRLTFAKLIVALDDENRDEAARLIQQLGLKTKYMDPDVHYQYAKVSYDQAYTSLHGRFGSQRSNPTIAQGLDHGVTCIYYLTRIGARPAPKSQRRTNMETHCGKGAERRGLEDKLGSETQRTGVLSSIAVKPLKWQFETQNVFSVNRTLAKP